MMPILGTGEPDVLPYLKFRLDDVACLSPTPNPTNIVQAGQPVELRVDLGLEGFWAGLCFGEQYRVFHHIERIEDGDRKTLPGGTFTVPNNAADAANFNAPTGPYTTGNPGSGTQFEVAPGFASGTFRILTHIHFVDPAKEPIVTAFHEHIVMVA